VPAMCGSDPLFVAAYLVPAVWQAGGRGEQGPQQVVVPFSAFMQGSLGYAIVCIDLPAVSKHGPCHKVQVVVAYYSVLWDLPLFKGTSDHNVRIEPPSFLRGGMHFFHLILHTHSARSSSRVVGQTCIVRVSACSACF
jgi:hypothetical protein